MKSVLVRSLKNLQIKNQEKLLNRKSLKKKKKKKKKTSPHEK